jgi:hypothetical protein
MIPQTYNVIRTALATMITDVILRMNLPRSAPLSAEITTFSSFEGVAAWCMSVLVKKNPGREGEDDHQARIDERGRTEVWLQMADLNDPMRNERQGQSADDADHPCRKVRAKNIDGW